MNERSLIIVVIMHSKRNLILRAAEKIISTGGIQGLSMQQVANEAGVAAGTIYRYFKDKNELILELRKDVLSQVAAAILQDHQIGTLEERFKRIWMKMHEYGKQASPTNLSYEQYAHLPESNTEEIRALEMKLFEPLHRLFEEGLEQGVIQPLHPRALYAIAMEPSMAMARAIRRGLIQYDQKDITLACDLCWRAILIPTTPTN
ncbi:TetR family transcriptional regulator [Shewanella sairae]|uniref:TetR family transcriptional regulator n=1 Tax=Shewanella sairae TaxID=190310 RepID=A0ABQ4PI06_9GAMM|nr:TetR/AcrR family transcriptional regulator [Shewanella sairae]MCL1131561.1 TetR/AcrR family transcriptional regulator [Shewanella sairae]GIU47187.1 TetR family transcriptional regulator [Shewanella sairae]